MNGLKNNNFEQLQEKMMLESNHTIPNPTQPRITLRIKRIQKCRIIRLLTACWRFYAFREMNGVSVNSCVSSETLWEHVITQYMEATWKEKSSVGNRWRAAFHTCEGRQLWNQISCDIVIHCSQVLYLFWSRQLISFTNWRGDTYWIDGIAISFIYLIGIEAHQHYTGLLF